MKEVINVSISFYIVLIRSYERNFCGQLCCFGASASLILSRDTGPPVICEHAIAYAVAYFAKIRISHILPHIMAFSKFRIFIYAFRIFIYA